MVFQDDGPGTEDEDALAIAALRFSIVTGLEVASANVFLTTGPSYF